MKGISKKFEQIFSAVAFAEEGEFETAREILGEGQTLVGKIKILKSEVEISVDNLVSMAITFAEAGEHDKALEIMKEAEEKLAGLNQELQRDFVSLSTSTSSAH
ncbi:MAG: hypothetical protein Q7U10_00585 [Thermodesulfovibrionia bacterium]|nr:hypothetical protein [Thermodesulfovibrionia bacterium]